MIKTILKLLSMNKKFFLNVFLCILTALSISYGIITHKENKRLLDSLEMANNNIEAYQGLLNSSQQANNVLQLTVDQLQNTKDKQIEHITTVAKENKVKPKQIKTAATQTQIIDVTSENETKIHTDSIVSDSIIYNIYTKLYYNIYNNNISTNLQIQNKQDLLIYSKREYKNKKNFIKRLLTLDFKKITKTEYKIINSNDLIQQDSVRVIQVK